MTIDMTIECFVKSTFFQKFHLQEKVEALNKHPEEDGELKSKLSSELDMKQEIKYKMVIYLFSLF